MKRVIILFILCAFWIAGSSQNQNRANHHFDNEYKPRPNSGNYFDWKIFLAADPAFLNSIRQVEYYLDPTFKNSTRIIKADTRNSNFTLCSNGGGEFMVRIKIVFRDNRKAALNEVYRLNLHSADKKKANYVCRF